MKKIERLPKSFLANKLIQTLGIDITKDGYLKDQDNLTELVADHGKLIRYINPDLDMDNPEQAIFVNRNIEIPFNPFVHYNILKLLTSYFLGKLEEDDVYYSTMSEDKDKVTGKQRVVLTDEQGNKVISNLYFNLAIAYMDIIFRLDEVDMYEALVLHDEEVVNKKKR